ncbi:gustatory and odorant receptor 22-like isoform X1 [Bactrocera dorsalis]|uniref:Gustatory and odorant receptor 22-like isoform X1 n=1 Tax=Bactrocera dorsalis TaxID=27457 RepID=A0ABM3JAI5_BACDO|nr:gustatory and odorant receptor 22-like isoform X1 [Bactrocera dorsalis]
MLWINLSELLQSLGNAYARTYSTYCIFIFVNIVIAVYGAFAEIFDHTNLSRDSYKEFGLIVDGLYCSILLFIFCDCSHNATLCVAKGIQNVLLKIDVRQINRKAKSEIDLFIFAIEMNPAIVSLKGYVNVNRELLTSPIPNNYQSIISDSCPWEDVVYTNLSHKRPTFGLVCYSSSLRVSI